MKKRLPTPLFSSLTYPNGTSTGYSYDNASRLTAIAHNGPSGLIEGLSYAHDAAGNRISLTRTNGTATNLPAAVQAAYDAANEQIQFNSASPNQTFDANGNLTSDGTNTYTWDARNRLTAISGPGTSANFIYDALGRRTSKTINGVTTQYLYDENDVVQEIGGSAVGASYVRSLNIDEAFVRQTGSGNEFYHVDALGSTLDLTNQAGTVQASYQYEAFGKTTITGASLNPFQYTGRENDGTGLYYYRARYYSPRLQRFLREDPIGFKGGDKNLYAYVGNSSINFVDPFGLLRLSREFITKYPKAARRIMTLDRRITQKMIKAYKQYGQAGRKDVLQALFPGKGPNVVAENLSRDFGQFVPGTGSNMLAISATLLNDFENGSASARFLDATVLHELTHYFDDQDGVDYPGEEGELFEIESYGRVIDR